MKALLAVVCASLLVQSTNSAQIQTSADASPVSRDPQGLAVLQHIFTAFGGVMPTDSTATGQVTTVAGSLTSQGTVRIQTRSTNQTSIKFQTTSDNWSVVYSNGEANKINGTETKVLPLELTASSQCMYFPFPFLAGLLNNPDVSIQYVGQEALDSSMAYHIRVLNTFNSATQMQFLSDFTLADIWLDSNSALPLQISMTRRDGGGSSPRTSVMVSYSNYQSISGVKYPFEIREFINGTPWATTTIQSVSFNTGLTDTDFAVVQGAN